MTLRTSTEYSVFAAGERPAKRKASIPINKRASRCTLYAIANRSRTSRSVCFTSLNRSHSSRSSVSRFALKNGVTLDGLIEFAAQVKEHRSRRRQLIGINHC